MKFREIKVESEFHRYPSIWRAKKKGYIFEVGKHVDTDEMFHITIKNKEGFMIFNSGGSILFPKLTEALDYCSKFDLTQFETSE